MVVSIGRKDEADLNGRRQKEGEREEAKYGRYEIGLVEQESIRVVPVALGTRDRHDAKDDSLERQPSFREHVRQNILGGRPLSPLSRVTTSILAGHQRAESRVSVSIHTGSYIYLRNAEKTWPVVYDACHRSTREFSCAAFPPC